jgi:beta-glucosidase
LPDSLGQSPAHLLGNYHGKDKPLIYEEDILVGYRWFDAKNLNPAFPFGHGLSYTSFKYSDLEISSSKNIISISFNLQNTGKLKGAETAQLYISAPGKEAIRPPLELKGFQKLEINPGETKKVVIELNKKELAWFNEMIHDWQIEEGDYKFNIGSSSRDIRLSKEITIN